MKALNKHSMSKILKEESGLTLLELIIAMVMMAIISMAAFMGIQYAFVTLSASKEYVDDVYVLQTSMENDLSTVYDPNLENILDDVINDVDVSGEFSSEVIEIEEETINFEWPSGSGLTDFKTDGIRILREAEGGTYLEEPIYIFIPVTNQDLSP